MNAEEKLTRLAETGTPPDGADIACISVGLETSLQRIVDETFPFVAAGGGELQFLHAPYGRGKTHFLRAIEQRAQDHGFVTAYVDCQDGDSPFRSLRQTYCAIARSMMPPRRQPFFASSGVAKVIEAQFAGNRTKQRALIDQILMDSALAPDYCNLVRSYSGFITGDEDEQFGDDIEALLAGEIGYRVTIGALYRSHPQVLRPLGKLGLQNAGVWLRSLLALPHILRYPGLVVMFDETEAVLNQGGTHHKQRHLAHIRTFVDHLAVGSFRGCAVYYAVVEDFIETAGQHLGALAQRIERVKVPEVTRNPRAVSVNLDELTEPGPRDPRFFEQLAERIVDLGQEAGLPSDASRPVFDRLTRDAADFAAYLKEGKVREFVKKAAGTVAREVIRHES